MKDVIIIGCGVIGASIAYELGKYQLDVLVLEKDNDVANGTSKANSAIVHAGYDPEEGTLMARLNVEGSEMMEALCKKLSVEYQRLGSLVLAFSIEEMETLKELLHRGQKNGVRDLRLLSADEAFSMEPNLSKEVKGALYAPTAAVISPWGLTIALAETAIANGVAVQLSTEVTGIKAATGGYTVSTNRGDYDAKVVINVAGVDGVAVANMAQATSYLSKPSRGQYFLLDVNQGGIVNHIIFQCPSAAGKGVLVAPTVHKNLIVGPSAEQAEDSTDVKTTQAGHDMVIKAAVKSVPNIQFRENIRNFAGVRAITDQKDFIIQGEKGFINVIGMKSPGLSAAPAVGKMVVDLVEKSGLALQKKENVVDTREQIFFRDLSIEDKKAVIARDPRFGRIICRCETITEGEIVAALSTNLPNLTLNGIKRRTGAGSGRCQGGFCGPRVAEIIAREKGVSIDKVLMDSEGTFIITSETKVK